MVFDDRISLGALLLTFSKMNQPHSTNENKKTTQSKSILLNTTDQQTDSIKCSYGQLGIEIYGK